MKKRLFRNEGRALTELLLVMVILLVFGVSTFAMVLTGQQASQQLIDRQESLSEMRTAYAYINTRLRQHDELGMISIRPHPSLPTKALVIKEEYYGTSLETWIYFNQGYLREVLISPGESIEDDISFPIARIDGLYVNGINQGQTIEYEVTYDIGKETLSRRGYYELKTEQSVGTITQ